MLVRESASSSTLRTKSVSSQENFAKTKATCSINARNMLRDLIVGRVTRSRHKTVGENHGRTISALIPEVALRDCLAYIVSSAIVVRAELQNA
jgi:hypothetical protein